MKGELDVNEDSQYINENWDDIYDTSTSTYMLMIFVLMLYIFMKVSLSSCLILHTCQNVLHTCFLKVSMYTSFFGFQP